MKQKLPYLIAIILICIAPMGDTYILIPAMTDIDKALPGISLAQLNFILTISSLFVIPSSLIAGKLVETGRLGKKNCLLLGFTLFTLGGAAGGLWVNYYFLLFTRAVLGIGNGLATAMIVTVTADYFTEKEGATVMGLYTAVGGLLAIGLTVLSGYLTVFNWRYAFLVYLVCLGVIVFHGLVLKNKAPLIEGAAAGPAPDEEKTAEASSPRPSLGWTVWALVAITILSQTLGNSLYLALSGFIEGEGLGDASATGLANGFLTVAIVAVCLVFSPLYARLGGKTAILFFLLMAAGFLISSRAQSFAEAVMGLTVWGLGYGLTVPYVMQEAIVRPPRRLITFTGALVNSAIFLSFTLSTFVHPLVASLSGQEGVRHLFSVVGLTLLLCAPLAWLLLALGHKAKRRADSAAMVVDAESDL